VGGLQSDSRVSSVLGPSGHSPPDLWRCPSFALSAENSDSGRYASTSSSSSTSAGRTSHMSIVSMST
jgi:hypothetical protein